MATIIAHITDTGRVTLGQPGSTRTPRYEVVDVPECVPAADVLLQLGRVITMPISITVTRIAWPRLAKAGQGEILYGQRWGDRTVVGHDPL